MFNDTIYVRIDAGGLTLLHAQSGREWNELAEVARDESTGKVLAVGRDVQALRGRAGVSVGNGFLHPRTPIADFILAELALRAFIRHVSSRSWLALAPTIVMHPIIHFEGGLTPVEIRALHELAKGVGARHSFVWQGEVLSRRQIATHAFDEANGQLLY